MWTYLAISREAALSPTPQDDSRKPSDLGGSITTPSAVGSHSVTVKEDRQGLLVIFDKNIHNKDVSPQGLNKEFDSFCDVPVLSVLSLELESVHV